VSWKTRMAVWSVPLAAVLAAGALAAPPRAASFRMPSGNIACVYGAGSLRCDVLSGLRPEPRGRCELDWTGLTLGVTGAARPTCAGDTVYDRRSPVLAYGGTWRRAGLSCRSLRTGLRCTNRSGRGFVLAREGWRRL
jgi:hypothetical protein